MAIGSDESVNWMNGWREREGIRDRYPLQMRSRWTLFINPFFNRRDKEI